MNETIREKNYREQYALEDGAVIQCKDAEYTIVGRPIGYGGSSILYAAKKSDSEILFAVKEWFSNDNCTKFKRINGIVQPINPDDGKTVAQWERARENLINEKQIGQCLFNTSTRTIPTWSILTPISITTSGETHTDVAAGIFSVQPRFDTKAKSLEDILSEISASYSPKERRNSRGLPNIHLTACLMEEVLRALQQIHNARDPKNPHMQGYYYGDLHTRNVFFAETDITRKYVGIAHLLDYGSSLVLDQNGHTKQLVIEDVFSTDGYRPPEANEKGGFKLDQRADIYSAGCLLYRCVVSKAKFAIAEDARSPILGPSALSEIDGKAIGCSSRALTLLNSILDNATKEDKTQRYPTVEAMLAAMHELRVITEPPKNLLPENLSSPDFPISHSRDKELEPIMRSIQSGEIVFIHGVGGIGKTEVAIELAKRLNPPKGAYLVHFQNSMRETILNLNFSGYKYEPNDKYMSKEENEEADYQARLRILKEQYQDVLIIIDNFDVPGKTLDDLRKEPAYQDFLGLSNIKKVYTTRYPIDRKEWEIRRLPDDVLLEIMRHYCTNSKISDRQLRELIDAVDGHTLTLILIAKTMEESWWRITPKTILRALKSSSLHWSDFPEISSDQNRSYQQQQIYGHLKALFNVSGMKETEKTVLSHASMLPRSGMDVLVFERGLEKKERRALHTLVKQGWLTRSEENKIQMHPIIREVCKTELNPIQRGQFMLMLRWILPLSMMLIALQTLNNLALNDSLVTRLTVAAILLLCYVFGRWVESIVEKLADMGNHWLAKTVAGGVPMAAALVFAIISHPNSDNPIWPGIAAFGLWLLVGVVGHIREKRKRFDNK